MNNQLKTLQTDSIDYYLLHGLNLFALRRLVGLGILDFLDVAKIYGRVKYAGFSFHATNPEF